jgi:hypothetical protein
MVNREAFSGYQTFDFKGCLLEKHLVIKRHFKSYVLFYGNIWWPSRVAILGWSLKKYKVLCVIISICEMDKLEKRCDGQNFNLWFNDALCLFLA